MMMMVCITIIISINITLTELNIMEEANNDPNPWISTIHRDKYFVKGPKEMKIIKIDPYTAMGLAVPKCGKSSFLPNIDIVDAAIVAKNIKEKNSKQDTTHTKDSNIKDSDSKNDNRDEMSDNLAVEEIIGLLCHFMTCYNDDIYPNLYDYEILYNRILKYGSIHKYDISTNMIPHINLLEEILDDKFSSYNILNETCKSTDKRYKKQQQSLSLIISLIHNLWSKFTDPIGGTLSGNY